MDHESTAQTTAQSTMDDVVILGGEPADAPPQRRWWPTALLAAALLVAGVIGSQQIAAGLDDEPATITVVPDECMDTLEAAEAYQIAANEVLYGLTYSPNVEAVWAASSQLDVSDSDLARVTRACRTALEGE